MRVAPQPSDEAARLQALRRYHVLDTDAESAFDDLTALVAHICQTPMALISLVDADRQWFKSKVGLEVSQTSRDVAFCAHTILQPDQPLIVPNTLEDERFADNPLVTAAPHIQFYAGTPLVTPEGFALGTLCVLDCVPRQLSPAQLAGLQACGRQVMDQLAIRMDRARLKRLLFQQQQTAQQLEAERHFMAAILETAGALVVVLDPQGRIVRFNRACEQTTHYSFAEVKGIPFWDLFLTADEVQEVRRLFEQLRAGHFPNEHENDWVTREGEQRRILWSNTAILNAQGAVKYIIGTGIDVTERRQAEAALRQAQQQQYQSLVDSIDGVVWELDLQTLGFLAVSQRVEQLLGYPLEQWLNEPNFWQCHVHPDDRDWVVASCYAHQQAQPDHELEYRMLAANERIVWVHDIVTVVVENDRPVKRRSVIIDITQRKQTEMALQLQVERERLMVAIAQRIRASLDLETILKTTVTEVRALLHADRVLVYRVWSDGTGSVVMEAVLPNRPIIMGQTFPEEVFPHEYQQLYCQGRSKAIADVEQATVPPCLVEFLQQFEVKAKLVVPILQGADLWGCLIAHQCSHPRQWQPQDVDLLEQLATQLAIAIQQSELYQQVQRFNANLEVQVQERTAQLQQALTFEALLKRITDKVRDSLDEAQILQTVLQELTLGLAVDHCDTTLYDHAQTTSRICHDSSALALAPSELNFLIKDYPDVYHQLLQGQCFQGCQLHPVQGWMVTLACPIFDDQGVFGNLWLFKQPNNCYAFSDAAIRLVQQVASQCAIALRQARLYKAAQAQVEELEKLNRLKDDFLSTVSHELRSPVSNMKMAIQMLELTLNRDSGFVPKTAASNGEGNPAMRYLQILDSECKREISLINDLLDLQRLEVDQPMLCLSEIPLPTWLPQVVLPFHERAQHRQHTFQVQISPDLPVILSDAASLERILVELLTNASKYTPPGNKIAFTATVVAGTVQLQVCNEGIQIPAANLPYIFDKFYRVPHADRWKQGGTGLGLALVKKLAENLDIQLDVESTAAQTIFSVRLKG